MAQPTYTLEELSRKVDAISEFLNEKTDRNLLNLNTVGQVIIDGKASIDLDNLSPVGQAKLGKAQIIDTYVNGTSGYRIWSDGYCEQWGFNPATAQDRTPYALTLLKTYKDTNYQFIRVPKGISKDFDILYGFGATNIDGNHVTFYTSNTNYYIGDNWQAHGYLAEGEY